MKRYFRIDKLLQETKETPNDNYNESVPSILFQNLRSAHISRSHAERFECFVVEIISEIPYEIHELVMVRGSR